MKSIITSLVFCVVFFNSLQASHHKTSFKKVNLKNCNVFVEYNDSTLKFNHGKYSILSIRNKLYFQHTVLHKENLNSIAKKYFSNSKEISNINKLKGKSLKDGTLILIPTNKGIIFKITGFSYDDVYKNRNDSITRSNFMRDSSNNINSNKRDSSLKEFHANANSIDAKEVYTHFVQAGESIEMIAKKYKITLNEISIWNTLQQNKIRVGQELIINNAKARKPYFAINLPFQRTENTNSSISDSLIKTESGICILVNDGMNEVLHKSLPIGTLLLVTNLVNKKSMYLKTTQNFADSNMYSILMIDKEIAQKLGIEKSNTSIELKYTPLK